MADAGSSPLFDRRLRQYARPRSGKNGGRPKRTATNHGTTWEHNRFAAEARLVPLQELTGMIRPLACAAKNARATDLRNYVWQQTTNEGLPSWDTQPCTCSSPRGNGHDPQARRAPVRGRRGQGGPDGRGHAAAPATARLLTGQSGCATSVPDPGGTIYEFLDYWTLCGRALQSLAKSQDRTPGRQGLEVYRSTNSGKRP